MNFPTRIVTLLLLTGGLVGTSLSANNDFFRPATDKGAHLPEGEIYPQGRTFPYTGFSGNPERDKGNGFTMYGPVYRQNESFLAKAKETNTKAAYSIGIDMNFLQRNGEPALDLSPEEIRAQIKAQVEAVMHEDTIAWWYLVPEELRHWRPAEREYLQVASDTIRETDPKKRPVWMYEPGHRTAAAMSHVTPYLDIVGKGLYTNYSGQKDSRVWARWTIEAQDESIRMVDRKNAFSIAVPEMFVEPDPSEVKEIKDWVRHDVYLSLVSGARGVVIFSLWKRRSLTSFDEYYEAYSGVGKELNGKMNLGPYFLFGEERKDISVEITAGEKTVAPKIGSGGVTEANVKTYDSISVGNYALGDKRLVIFVNSSEGPVSATVKGIPGSAKIDDLFRNFKMKHVPGGFSIDMHPHQVIGLLVSAR